MVRYMDDIVCFGANKRELKTALERIVRRRKHLYNCMVYDLLVLIIRLYDMTLFHLEAVTEMTGKIQSMS